MKNIRELLNDLRVRMGLKHPVGLLSEPVPIKIGDHQTTVPQGWHHLTVRQFIRLKAWDGDDVVEMIACMLNLDYEIISSCKLLDLDLKLTPLLSWARKPYQMTKMEAAAAPGSITLAGKSYPRPMSLGPKTFGQRILIDNAIRDAMKKKAGFDLVIPDVVAIVFADQVTGRAFDAAGYAETKELVLDAKLTEVYPMASFFFRRYVNWLNATHGSKSRTARKKFLQALNTASKGSGTSTPSTVSQSDTAKTGNG